MIFQKIVNHSIKMIDYFLSPEYDKNKINFISSYRKEMRSMSEKLILFMTIVLLIILTAVFVDYMRGRVDSRDYIFHKIWYLFTYASLKTEILIGTGITALESLFRNERREEFSKYSLENPRVNEICKKKQKLREMKEVHGNSRTQKKELFNLKILR